MCDTSTTRIIRLSRTMARLVTLAFYLIPPLITAYALILPEQLPYHGGVAMAGFEPHRLSLTATAAVTAALLTVSLPLMWGLWELKGLFQGYAAGRIFTVEAAGRLRRCGYALTAAAAKTAVGSTLLSAALSIDMPAGRRSLVLSLSSDDLILLLIGGTVLVIARVMAEAARIAEDNAGFV